MKSGPDRLKVCRNDRDAGLGRGHRPVYDRAGGFISRVLDRKTRAAGKRADLAIRTIERACVKMPHKSAGLTIDENGTTCKVTLQIKNPLICDMNECM